MSTWNELFVSNVASVWKIDIYEKKHFNFRKTEAIYILYEAFYVGCIFLLSLAALAAEIVRSAKFFN